MIGLARGVRLVPVVLFATASLLVLKTAGIVVGSGYTLGGLPEAWAQTSIEAPTATAKADKGAPTQRVSETPAPPKRSWAQEMFNYPEVTGSVSGSKAAAPEPAKPAEQASKPAEQAAKTSALGGKTDGNPLGTDGDRFVSPGERAVLERLQERRHELEARARELDIREGLLKAAEKRIESRIGELKELETQVNLTVQKKDEAEAARFKGVVAMYESMKAKEAARVFDRLDMRILLEVATQINPRRMSDILAQMSPEAAERLTVELASRPPPNGKPVSPADLPKIEGKPRS